MFRVPFRGPSILRTIFVFAGILTMAATLAGYFLHPLFLVVAVLVGAMQVFFALTGYCPLAAILREAGIPCRFDAAWKPSLRGNP